MNKPLPYFMLLFATVFFSCEKNSSDERPVVKDKDILLQEKQLIPEGVAFDERNNTIFVGGTYLRKIVQLDAEGKESEFIPQEFEGMWSPLGMEVDENRDILWVNTAHINQVMPLINPSPEKDWMTNVTAFDISEKKVIKKYSIPDSACFNDLTTSITGDVYITECVNNKLYLIDREADSLQLFLALNGYNFPNGIALDDKNQVLFVGTVEGLLRVDIASKQHILLYAADSVDAKFVDGLSLNGDYLIAHQSSKISKFHLNPDRTEITKVEILDSGADFDASTTGEIGNGAYHYIVNSQIQSGVDYANRTIKPMDSLEQVIIRSKKLKN